MSEDPWAWGQSENRLAYGIPGASPDPTPCPGASQYGAGSICHTGTGERAGALGLSSGLLSYSLEKRTEREQEWRENCLGMQQGKYFITKKLSHLAPECSPDTLRDEIIKLCLQSTEGKLLPSNTAL